MAKYLTLLREKDLYAQDTPPEKPKNSNNMVFRGGDVAHIKVKSGKVATNQPALKTGITCQAFKKRGIDLLPEDRTLLLRYLPKATKRRRAVVNEYQRRWLEAAAREPQSYRKQNRGRLVANTWLRVESSTWSPM